MASLIRYVPAGVAFLLPLWVCVVAIAQVLGQWYPVSITFISFANDNGLSFTCDEYIFFSLYCYAMFSEHGHVAIVNCLAHTH